MMDKEKFVRIARGEEAAELVLKNANVFFSFTGEFGRGDIAIADGRIAGIGQYQGKNELDLTGKYITPGFLDGHVHIESSMLSPAEFANAVVPTGTTTVIADPHEIANVAGLSGIRYMLQATENLPLNVYFMLPSCVPATPLEDSGAVLLAEDLAPLLKEPRVLGLAELMNVPGVLYGDPDVYAKLAMVADGRTDGHAPGLSGRDLMAYAAAGVGSDHECVNGQEALERLRAGMYLLVREGSAAKNLRALLPIITSYTAPFCCFVTDDRHPADLLQEGHINHMVRKAVNLGLPIPIALQMATINTARYFGLRDIGAIAPNYRADLLVFDNLKDWQPELVFKNGRLTAEKGKMKCPGKEIPSADIEHTMHVAPIKKEQLRIPMQGTWANVIGLIPEQILTKKLQIAVRTIQGEAVSDPEYDVLKLAVFERHHMTGKCSMALVQGFGLKHGAIASTVSHDSHNLIIIGVSDDDILLAARELENIGGGVAVVDHGKVLGSLALPIGGLMSNRGAREVSKELAALKQLAYALGIRDCYDPFLTLAFLSLPVIPSLKLTDVGLVDVDAFKFIPVAAEE